MVDDQNLDPLNPDYDPYGNYFQPQSPDPYQGHGVDVPPPQQVWQGGMPLVNFLAGHEDDWPGNTGGAAQGGMSEQEGRAYDQAHGYVGGYMGPNGWVSGSPTTSSGGGSGGGSLNSAFNPQFSPRANSGAAPAFNAPRMATPAPFAYDKQFTAPSAQELTTDPSFQFRLDQGRKTLEQSAAGKGVLRTGGTLKDLVNYGQDFASNEYGNVYNRKFDAYKFDYDKEADIYARNYGVQRDVFDRNYKASYDEYQPQYNSWQTNANNDQRAAELQFNREYDKYIADRNYDLEKYKIVTNGSP